MICVQSHWWTSTNTVLLFWSWHQENVGQTQQIYIAKDSSTLLQNMTEDILRYANLLYNRFATTIDAADLSVIQQHFSAGEPSDRVWNHEDIQRLLRDLIQEKQRSLEAYCRQLGLCL